MPKLTLMALIKKKQLNNQNFFDVILSVIPGEKSITSEINSNKCTSKIVK